MLRFAGHEIDSQRAELRGRHGQPIRLRPKSFDMLLMLAGNARRIVSKQELIEAIWPNVHVSEDSLFQCIREIRAALGDDRRELIRAVSGRGYLFDADVTREPAAVASAGEAAAGAAAETKAAPVGRLSPFSTGRRTIFAAIAGLGIAGVGALIGLAVATPVFGPDPIFARKPPAIMVVPIAASGGDPESAEMAASVTLRLTNGLAGIDGIRVVAPPAVATSTSPRGMRNAPADFVVSAELVKGAKSWEAQARMTSAATGEVRWTTSVSVGTEDGDPALQQSRLAAGIGHSLALRVNALLNANALMRSGGDDALPAGNARVVIEQAMAVINQTTPERYRAAQTMLETALAADPDNVDLEIALAAHLMRGIQTVWYDPANAATTERDARAMLERALRAKPTYVPALGAYCRLLTATNQLAESLVACARTLSFDPWDGTALFNLGLTQILQGRFEEALATFKQADEFGTPQFSRWTWLLGAGLACMLMERNEEAVPWLERSLAITPGTGRTHMLLAVAYQLLGRHEEARAVMAKALELRPGSTAQNVSLPTRNASPVFLAASERLIKIEVELGLPER